MRRQQRPSLAMLYFHPWELHPEQVRLSLGALSRFRTYVGIRRSSQRAGQEITGFSLALAISASYSYNTLPPVPACLKQVSPPIASSVADAPFPPPRCTA
jgi:hypothetical protein